MVARLRAQATVPGGMRVLLVTGMSGAGKTSALKVLEDLGYESVDHVPLWLLGRLVVASETSDPSPPGALAIGIDVRTRGFPVGTVISEVDRLARASDCEVRVVFLDCEDDELRRRYTATRHRHPLADDRPLTDGIAMERQMMAPLRTRADVVIDTSGLELGALKRLLGSHFGFASDQGLTVFVTSFSFRQGLPREADLVFDVRFLANPYYEPSLRALTGRDPGVADFIRRDEGCGRFLEAVTGLMRPLLPRYAAEGRSYLTIAVGCTGGRHRSVYVAEELTAWLQQKGLPAHLRHRDLDRAVE